MFTAARVGFIREVGVIGCRNWLCGARSTMALLIHRYYHHSKKEASMNASSHRPRHSLITVIASLFTVAISLASPSAASADIVWLCSEESCSCGYIACDVQCSTGGQQGSCDGFCGANCEPSPVFCEIYPGCPDGEIGLTCSCS